MKLAIIGTGSVGGTLGKLLAAKGYSVTFGARDPHGRKVTKLLEQSSAGTTVKSVAEAIAGSDVVVLAIPWHAAEELVRAADLDGKILVDATNPIAAGLELALGHHTSAAEKIAAWAPGARVVKAFNTIGANNLENPRFGDDAATMFICGDDAQAKMVTAEMAEALGFEAVDAGPLSNARLLEPMAMLWIRLAMVEGQGRDIAFKLLRR